MKVKLKTFCDGLMAGVGASVGAGYIYATKPNMSRKEQMKVLSDNYIAHRGLFNNQDGVPENSLLAFKAAVDHHYGIELDVQMTVDGKLVVFHDDNLERICGVDKILDNCTYAELEEYRLLGTDQKIPLLDEVLEVVDGKVPLVIEVKPSGDWLGLTQRLAVRMDSYQGFYCMESFEPEAVEWYKYNRPHIIRGQLATDYFKDKPEMNATKKFMMTNLLQNFQSRPDFVAYNYKFRNDLGFRLFKLLYPEAETVAWTIKSQEQLEEAKKLFDCFIFDSFIPDSISDNELN